MPFVWALIPLIDEVKVTSDRNLTKPMNDTEIDASDNCDGCGKASAELTHADDGTFCADCIKARGDIDLIADIERLKMKGEK